MLPTLILLALLAQSPDSTQPPAAAHIAYTVEGRGSQIYRCTQQGSAYAWVFQSPEATLYEATTHRQTGTHSAGPTWTWNDGSSITGQVLQKSSSSDPDSVPWLLLAATPAGTTTGVLTPIKLVRRSDTHGGNAPATGCDASHGDAVLRVPYTATYTFYTTP